MRELGEFDAEIDAFLRDELQSWFASLRSKRGIGAFDLRIDDVNDLLTLHLSYDDSTNDPGLAFDHGTQSGGVDREVSPLVMLQSMGIVPSGTEHAEVDPAEAHEIMQWVVARCIELVQREPALFENLSLQPSWFFQRGFYSGADAEIFLRSR